jgi:23S rRNA (uridine2552-2'-O)-methyltransferase
MRRSEDYFSRLAKQKGFPARSVFKLQEMDERFRLIRPGARILDLGASPGSWSRYCLQKLGGRGLVVGVDLNAPSLQDASAGFRFLQGDLFDEALEGKLSAWGPYDLILSDAAPHTSGTSLVDSQASLKLAERALVLARLCLKAGASMVVKVFQGGEESLLLARMRAVFRRARAFKPGASRSESREVYFLGLEKKACGAEG